MRIFKIDFVIKRKECFRIGAYVGKVIFKFRNYALVKDCNNGAKQMNFSFINK